MLIYKIRYIENNFPVEKIFEFFNRIGRNTKFLVRDLVSVVEKKDSRRGIIGF